MTDFLDPALSFRTLMSAIPCSHSIETFREELRTCYYPPPSTPIPSSGVYNISHLLTLMPISTQARHGAFYVLICVFILIPSSSYSKNVSTASDIGKFRSVFITDNRINMLKQVVVAKKEPTYSAFKTLRQYANNNLYRCPIVPKRWYVAYFYINSDDHMKGKKGLQNDANAAYALALCLSIGTSRKGKTVER